MTTKTKTDTALRAAMTRLLAGQPLRTDGRLTVSNLAREAGVGRASANRATGILNEFRVAIARQQHRRFGPAGSRARIRDLEAELATQRARHFEEDKALRATTHRMAQHIQALALHAVAQDREIARLRDELKRHGATVIVPIARAARLAPHAD